MPTKRSPILLGKEVAGLGVGDEGDDDTLVRSPRLFCALEEARETRDNTRKKRQKGLVQRFPPNNRVEL